MGIFDRLQTYMMMLRQDPLNFVLEMAILAAALLISLILHEVAHGFVAWRCGDPTAKWMGRLSLNPAKHLDPIGTAALVLLGIGWARPVPVNPRNFRHYRLDDFLVSIAGIVTNLILFVIASFFMALSIRFLYTTSAFGTKAFSYVYEFFSVLAGMNASLAIFNLLPFPPLDGFHIFNDVLLRGRLNLDRRTHEIARGILIVICLSGVLSRILGVAVDWLMQLPSIFLIWML